MASFNKYYCFTGDLGQEIHNFDTDTIRVCLSNTAPVPATDTLYSGITEIAAGNGYTTGGEEVTVTWTNSTLTWSLTGTNNVSWTASGGAIATFRYAILYNATSGALIGYFDYGSALTVSDGESFQGNSNGVLLTVA